MSEESWKTVELQDIADINSETLSSGTFPHFHFRYFDITSVTSGKVNWAAVKECEFRNAPTRARRIIRSGDTLFSTVRAGLQAHVNVDWIGDVPDICSTGFAVLRPRTCDPRFLFHKVFSDEVTRYVRQREVGSNYPAVNESDLKVMPLLAPESTLEQAEIAKVLDTADLAIQRTQAITLKLRRIRSGFLCDLLSFGLDDHGHVRNPLRNPETFQDSCLGYIPKHWETPTLEDAAAKIQDGTHFSPKSRSGPRKYITSKNIRFGYLDLSQSGLISEAEHREIYKRCDVKKDDILLTKDGANTGNVALNTLEEEFSLLSSVAMIRCRSNLHPAFLLHYLLSPLGQKRLKDMMSGNAITRLTLARINSGFLARLWKSRKQFPIN